MVLGSSIGGCAESENSAADASPGAAEPDAEAGGSSSGDEVDEPAEDVVVPTPDADANDALADAVGPADGAADDDLILPREAMQDLPQWNSARSRGRARQVEAN